MLLQRGTRRWQSKSADPARRVLCGTLCDAHHRLGARPERSSPQRGARVEHDGRAMIPAVQRRLPKVEQRRHRKEACPWLVRQHKHERRLIDARQQGVRRKPGTELGSPQLHQPHGFPAYGEHAAVHLPAAAGGVGRCSERVVALVWIAPVPARVRAHEIVAVRRRCSTHEQCRRLQARTIRATCPP